jgi:hypothetical protein
VPNACKSHAECLHSEWRTAEDHVGTCLLVGDNSAKALLIPHTLGNEESGNAQGEWPAAHQVVGGVMAYLAGDG